MPADLLLPAFALTLLANAVLIALAFRALRRGRFDGTENGHRIAPIRAARTAAAVPKPRPEATPPRVDAAMRREPTAEDVRAPVEPAAVAPPPTEPRTSPAEVPVAAPSKPRRARTSAAATPAAQPRPPADIAAAPATRRGRRKFSLPPLDDDHEKVNRSIESFLTGAEAPAETSSGPQLDPAAVGPNPAPAGGSHRPATTVALIAVAGLPGAGLAQTVPDDASAEDAAAMLERTLRSAARGSDEVHVDAPGRFRVVLPATGELAARAYLRRIRATVEPQLEAADRPLRLVVATATALNIPVRQATGVARTRLESALAAHAEGSPAGGPAEEGDGETDANDRDGEPRPRAAAD